MDSPLTWLYIPTAIMLGALHALEPGHAKTLTAAYLIGIRGTKRDAMLLGLSVAATHSVVVIGLSMAALWLGREAFTDKATYWLQMGSGIIVILLGAWLLWKRWGVMQRQKARESVAHTSDGHEHGHHDHPHGHEHHDHEDHDFLTDHEHAAAHASDKHHHDNVQHDHDHEHGHSHDDHSHDHHHEHGHHHDREHDEDHDLLTDDEHAAAHAATLPKYVETGERPTALQIIAFGGAGGMIPCPASITVMLLALSAGRTGFGLVTVLGFSLGLAITLVGVGLIIVAGLSKLQSTGRFAWVTRKAPLLSAGMVMFSGLAAVIVSLLHR